jgi:hypothetical protein
MMYLGGDDPVRIEALERYTLLSYWALLDKKRKEIDKAIADMEKNKGRRK